MRARASLAVLAGMRLRGGLHQAPLGVVRFARGVRRRISVAASRVYRNILVATKARAAVGWGGGGSPRDYPPRWCP